MKNTVFLVAVFTVVWIILTETFAIWSIAAGFVISIACAFFCHRLLYKAEITESADVRLWRLAVYAFYLIGQIYISGLFAIRLIVKGAKTDIVEINTDIENDFLRVMLANSITLTPGTLTLGLTGDRLTVLWLRDKSSGFDDSENADESIKGGLERMLRKAQK